MIKNINDVTLALKSIVANELNLNLRVEQLDENEPLLEEGLDLDSIVIVELIGIVEDRFGFQFHDADLRTSSFKNLQTLAQVILKRISDVPM